MNNRLVRRTVLAAAFALPLATAGTASAGGFHVHFGGHVGGGFHWSGGGGHWSGGSWGGGWRGPHVNWGTHVSGGIWVGSYQPYYYPTYYPTYYSTAPACECGPSAYYPPVYPAPSAEAALVAPEPPPMPTFGVGLFAGGTTTANNVDGNDVGLFANLRITRGLLIQGEIGKSELANGARVDRRFEGALVWELGSENAWAPYLLGGLGVEGADTADSSAMQNFGEVGAGIRWAVTRNFHLTADIRAGSRDTMSDSGSRTVPGTLAQTVAPPSAGSGQTEDFTRARLGAMIYF